MERDRSYYRYVRNQSIRRKKGIITRTKSGYHVKASGVLSKGKIHCSCWMCRTKSYDDIKVTDKRKLDRDISKLEEYESGGEI